AGRLVGADIEHAEALDREDAEGRGEEDEQAIARVAPEAQEVESGDGEAHGDGAVHELHQLLRRRGHGASHTSPMSSRSTLASAVPPRSSIRSTSGTTTRSISSRTLLIA